MGGWSGTVAKWARVGVLHGLAGGVEDFDLVTRSEDFVVDGSSDVSVDSGSAGVADVIPPWGLGKRTGRMTN